MKKTLAFLLLLLITMGCYAQVKQVTLSFSPSFIEKSNVTIKKEGTNYSMKISTEKFQETCYVTESSMSDLQRLFVTYAQRKFTEDSLENVRKLAREKELQKLRKKGRILQDLSLDGIAVHVVLLNKNNQKSFNVSSDKKSIDYTFMKLLFKLMNASFKNNRTITYVEQLEGYFSLGLGLKKLSDKPLTYKLYGCVSSNEEIELRNFFNKLPMDKEIIFNMSNFQSMGTMFYPSFNTLCKKNTKIKWINCTAEAKRQLLEAGIKPSSIR